MYCQDNGQYVDLPSNSTFDLLTSVTEWWRFPVAELVCPRSPLIAHFIPCDLITLRQPTYVLPSAATISPYSYVVSVVLVHSVVCHARFVFTSSIPCFAMFLTSCLHTSRYCASSPDSPFPLKSKCTVSIHLRFGLPFLLPATSILVPLSPHILHPAPP